MKVIRVTTVPQSLHQLLKPQLDFLKNDFEIITASGPYDQENIDQYGNWPYKHYEILLSRTINPIKDIKAILQLKKILKKEKPCIIHTHTPKAGFIGMIAGRLAKVPIRLHTVAGMPLAEITGMQKKILLMVEKLTYSCAHQVMPNSQGLFNFIVEHKLAKPDKLKIIANGGTIGIDLNKYSRTPEIEQQAVKIREETNILSTDFVCCFIGRLTKQKGVEEMLTAFKKIFLQHPHVKLILLGRYEQHLDPIGESYISLIKTNPNIIHFGYQLDIRPYLSMSNLFVFPSYREGLPNVVLQAGCFDLPSVVTNIAGSNEIIKDGYNGVIVPVKDSEYLRQAIINLIENDAIRNRMSKCARKEMYEKYDQQLILQEIKKEYYKWIHEKNI